MSTARDTHNVFAIAASAGGIQALSKLVSALPEKFPATVFITQHTSPLNRRSYLTDILNNKSPLSCRAAADGLRYGTSEVYIAPPDRHLLIHDGYVETTRGPRENHSRPAADPMFRSAAAAHGARVVGIVLTGYLDDGSSGLVAIKGCGGKAIVQHPDDALVPDMPRNAMTYIEPDFVLPIPEIASTMVQLAHTRCGESVPASPKVLTELEFARSFASNISAEESLGDLSPYMCPDCAGQLWRSQVDQVPRFRCHVGHAHTLRSLIAAQGDVIERNAWSTLRMLKEQVETYRLMAKHELDLGQTKSASYYEESARITDLRAQAIRKSFVMLDEAERQG